MLKTGKEDSICNSTGEKESIMAPNLWFHERLYKRDLDGNKTTKGGVEDCLQEALKLQNELRSQKPLNSQLFPVLRQKPKEKIDKPVALKRHREENYHGNIYIL